MRPGSVCVCVPVKDGRRYLAEALDSVLAQEGVELDVHVVDNGSTDDSIAIAEGYAARDPRVRVSVNERDVNYYGSLNRALAETDAEYFVPFACDDLMAPGNLARKVAALAGTDAAFAHSSTYVVDADSVPQRIDPDHRETPPFLAAPGFFTIVAARNTIIPAATVIRVEALRAIGGFDARSLYCGDWLAWQRMALRWPVVTLHEPLASYRRHAEAGTHDSHAKGYNGRDFPATLERLFLDDAMPSEWAGWRDALVSGAFRDVSFALHDVGLHRVEQGWAAYMSMGRAVARQPTDALLHARYRALVECAGLTPPQVPLEAVAVAPAAAEDAAALAETVAELGPLLARLVIALPPDGVEAAMAVLEPALGSTDRDVVCVPEAAPANLLAPGRITLARWGSELVTISEAAGVPVFPYAIPNPFDRPADPALWQTVNPEGCLP